MLKLSDLAKQPDFRIGQVLISPARRMVEGPAGQAHVEPVVMQVLVLLLDSKGEVVTRQELFDQVWGGVMIGDDSLNRAISGVRRVIAETGPDLFGIETIPRTGYRLTITNVGLQGCEKDGLATSQSRFTRRAAVVGAIAVAGSAGGFGLWSMRTRDDQRFKALMDRAEQAVDFGDPSSNAAQLLQRAVVMRPNNAAAQGLFAYTLAMRADGGAPDVDGKELRGAERAAQVALEVDPNEPHARLAQVLIERSMLDFAATEDRLRQVLETRPDNIRVMRHLWNVLQCVGRSGEALAVVERAIALKPLAAANNYPRAQLLWITGRKAEADRIIDRAMQYWPSHRFVRFARFTILAFTDRPRTALAMLESKATAPQNYSPEAIALWRISLAALDQPTPMSIATARAANLEAAKRDPRLSSQAVLALSALGETDAAFEIANALFVVPSRQARASSQPARSTAWRFAPWLFTPPTAPLRADSRFDALCHEIGLTDYWARRGVKPDYQIRNI